MKHSDVKISYNYANAWYERACDLKEEDKVYNDCISLQSILKSNSILLTIFSSPLFSVEKKNAIFNLLITDKTSNVTKSIFPLLNKNKRTNILDAIIEFYINIYRKKKDYIVADVVTTTDLNKKLSEKMKKMINKHFRGKDVILNNTIDKEIKGGFILRVNYYQYDKSLATMFNNIKTKLINI